MPYQDCIWPASVPETEEVASTVKILDTVDSTNSLIARAVAASQYSDASQCVEHLFASSDIAETQEHTGQDGQLPISIAISDVQTQCRGRQGRSWFNQPGESLLSSWAVPLPRTILTAAYSGWITTMCGLALIESVQALLHNHHAKSLNANNELLLKWPNDMFCQGRKLAGILCEIVPRNEDSAVLIIGIGMNLFVAQEDLPIDLATSLQLQYAPLPAYAQLRDELVSIITQHLREEICAFTSNPDAAIPELLHRVERVSWTLGKQVKAHLADERELLGRALSINADASLTILRHDGSRQRVTTADVGVLPNTSEEDTQPAAILR